MTHVRVEETEARVTLPQLKCLQQEAEVVPAKICYGDLYRANAPKPKVFVPDERTAKELEARRQGRIRYRERKRSTRGYEKVCRGGVVWTPEIEKRFLELIDDFRKSRMQAAVILTKEFPNAGKFSKGTLVGKYHRLKESQKHERARHHRDEGRDCCV